MYGEENDASGAGSDGLEVVQARMNGKFTLSTECYGLLTPDMEKEATFTSKSGEEAARYFHLDTLLVIPTIDQIRIKCFDTCGRIDVQDESCLTTLWRVGDWFVEQYHAIEKSAHYEKVTDGKGRDWTQPDATLIVWIG